MESTDIAKIVFGIVVLFLLYRMYCRYSVSRKAKEIEDSRNDGNGKVPAGKESKKEGADNMQNKTDAGSLPVIPIFFACDNNYLPFLSVTLKSMLANASKGYDYKIYVITTNLDEEYIGRIKEYEAENVEINIVQLREELLKITEKFHVRDYYSLETYYRFFIADLFPQYDKVLYMDCDIVVTGDVAELYNTQMEGNLLCAVQEEVMAEVDVFGKYVEEALGVNRYEYFNAGIMLMNLDGFRKEKIQEKFLDLLSRFKFRVTQDEDYLNVLCKGRVKLLNLGWNKTAFKNDKFDDKDLKIVHYKIHWKPWHYSNVHYEELFWKYAAETDFYDSLMEMRDTYGEDKKERDRIAYERLEQMAADDTADENRYFKVISRG